MMQEQSLDVLRRKLESGKVTSLDLVRAYARRIDRMNRKGPSLNAVAWINPVAEREAKRLDRERAKGRVRGPLHGIPILIKDNICTAGDGMPTTASSFALADFFAPEDAHVVKRLRRAGAIILGKTNLSEWAYFMSTKDMPSGYGSLQGQVLHPYDPTIDPLGSSTGSAVAVAANMIPVAVGTETNGSLTAPAKQCLIATIKPTLGLVSRSGIIPISSRQDTAGPLCRTIRDCALLLEAMAGTDPRDPATRDASRRKARYAEACGAPIRGMRIGLLSFLNFPDDESERSILMEAKAVFERHGATTVPLTIEAGRMDNLTTLTYEFKKDLNAFLRTMGDAVPMKSLADIIAFNDAHAERCLRHGQDILVASEATIGDLSEPAYHEARAAVLCEADRMVELMRAHRLDLVVAAKRTGYAPIAGLPCISIPARPLEGKTPTSLNLIGKRWHELDIIRAAYRYERSAKRRIPPRYRQRRDPSQ